MKTKLYFPDDDHTECAPLERYIAAMKEFEIEEIVLYPAKRDLSGPGFFCQKYNEVGERGKDSGCGKLCDGYAPRNGKNGICKHWRHCYEAIDEPITVKLSNYEN